MAVITKLAQQSPELKQCRYLLHLQRKQGLSPFLPSEKTQKTEPQKWRSKLWVQAVGTQEKAGDKDKLLMRL